MDREKARGRQVGLIQGGEKLEAESAMTRRDGGSFDESSDKLTLRSASATNWSTVEFKLLERPIP